MYIYYPTLFSIPKTAKNLGISYRQILKACKEGKIPFYQINNSLRMVNPEEVLAYIKQDVKGGQHD